MAYKNQTQCYRTFGGVRWANWCDVLDPAQETEIRYLKAIGIRFRQVKHPDGYRQAFIHPEDVRRATAAIQSGPGPWN